jgi:peptidyl-tRNA hydrolase, PTH1 family
VEEGRKKMKLVVGLGNPGKKYQGTRHNVGFEVVDRLVGVVDEAEVELVKPETFMNKSGRAVGKLMRKSGRELDELFVVHDDLDIKLGKYKIQKGKGPKTHKGLESIYRALGSRDFWHVRVGIENRKKVVPYKVGPLLTGEGYVLQKFNDRERQVIDKVVGKVAEGLKGQLGV